LVPWRRVGSTYMWYLSTQFQLQQWTIRSFSNCPSDATQIRTNPIQDPGPGASKLRVLPQISHRNSFVSMQLPPRLLVRHYQPHRAPTQRMSRRSRQLYPSDVVLKHPTYGLYLPVQRTADGADPVVLRGYPLLHRVGGNYALFPCLPPRFLSALRLGVDRLGSCYSHRPSSQHLAAVAVRHAVDQLRRPVALQCEARPVVVHRLGLTFCQADNLPDSLAHAIGRIATAEGIFDDAPDTCAGVVVHFGDQFRPVSPYPLLGVGVAQAEVKVDLQPLGLFVGRTEE